MFESIKSKRSPIGLEFIKRGLLTESQVERLKQMGCKVIQGFYFSKPIPLEEFENKYLTRK